MTIDWTVRESVQARIRMVMRRVLRKCGYPPDKQEKATQVVLRQTEVLCAEWAVRTSLPTISVGWVLTSSLLRFFRRMRIPDPSSDRTHQQASCGL